MEGNVRQSEVNLEVCSLKPIIPASFDILKEAVAYSAFHNSGARFDPPKCHPNTRVAVLNKIMDWVLRRDDETRDRFIMWLTGAAGAGKSAIAQSFIELCLRDNLIIASFFFGRSDGSRNHGSALVATLVYQIYQSIPAVQKEILSVIDDDPLILTRSMEHQFTQLLTKPLDTVCSSGSLWPPGSYRVIVIDGLDECLHREVQPQILRIISDAVRKSALPILFLIASRPEHEIKVEFSSQEMNGIHTRLYLDDTYEPDADIRKFLQDGFEKIKTTHPFKSRIPAVWPTHEIIERLVQKSSGQFIYAATVLRFTQSIRHQPHHRLEIVMNLRPAQGDLPFAQLDALYTMILCSAADIERVLCALSVYSLRVVKESKCSLNLEQFMDLEDGELDILFCDLGALVSVEWSTNSRDKRDKKLKILHASLHDFLLDSMRSKEYFINIDTYRTELLAKILSYVTSGEISLAYTVSCLLTENILDYDIMDRRVSSIRSFFRHNFRRCKSSPELIERASSFPLFQVFGTTVMGKVNFETAEFVFYTLLPFLKLMVIVPILYIIFIGRLLIAFP